MRVKSGFCSVRKTVSFFMLNSNLLTSVCSCTAVVKPQLTPYCLVLGFDPTFQTAIGESHGRFRCQANREKSIGGVNPAAFQHLYQEKFSLTPCSLFDIAEYRVIVWCCLHFNMYCTRRNENNFAVPRKE